MPDVLMRQLLIPPATINTLNKSQKPSTFLCSQRLQGVASVAGRTSSLGPSPTSATWRKIRCSSSRLKRASFVPKMRASTYCTPKHNSGTGSGSRIGLRQMHCDRSLSVAACMLSCVINMTGHCEALAGYLKSSQKLRVVQEEVQVRCRRTDLAASQILTPENDVRHGPRDLPCFDVFFGHLLSTARGVARTGLQTDMRAVFSYLPEHFTINQ